MASKLNAANKKNIDAPILLLMGGYAAPTIELKIQSIKIESDWAADLKNCLNKKKCSLYYRLDISKSSAVMKAGIGPTPIWNDITNT